MLRLLRPVSLVLRFPSRYGCANQKEISVGSKSFAVNQLSETAYASVRVADNGSDNELIRTNNMKLEAFAMRVCLGIRIHCRSAGDSEPSPGGRWLRWFEACSTLTTSKAVPVAFKEGAYAVDVWEL